MLIAPHYGGFKRENLLTRWNVLFSASLTFLSSDPSRMHKTDGTVCQAQEEKCQLTGYVRAAGLEQSIMGSLFCCVCALPQIEIYCEAKTTQDLATDPFDFFVFCCCCICENSLAVHWISLRICVHVSPFFLSVWGLDLFHFHSLCHVGLNVSDCCSFS